MEQARFTFAVCKKCGCQSPPIIPPSEIDNQLLKMGWKLDRMKFNIFATCPECQNDKEA